MTFIKRKLSESQDNEFKKLFRDFPNTKLSLKDKEEFFEDSFEDYMEMLKQTGGVFSEKDLLDHLKEAIELLDDLDGFIKDRLEQMKDSNIFKFNVYLKGHPEMNREFTVPGYSNINDIAYSVLSSFNAYKGYDYFIKYNDDIYVPSYLVSSDNKYINGKDVLLELLRFKINDELVIEYDDWTFILRVIEIYKETEKVGELFEPKILKVNGHDILDSERKMFDLLMEKKFDEVKKEAISKNHYKALMDYYNDCDFDLDQEEFMRRVYMQSEIYEGPDEYYDEDDEEEMENEFEVLKQLQELRRKEMAKLPHIKKYNKAKDLYATVLKELFNYLDKNMGKYQFHFEEYTRSRPNDFPRPIELKKVELNDYYYSCIFSCYVYPLDKGFESVCETYKKKNYLKGEKLEMLNSLIKSNVSLFEVVSYDAENGYVLLKDLLTKKEIDIVDINLTYSLLGESDWPYFLFRVFEYKGTRFADHALVISDRDEVDKYVKKLNGYCPISFDLYLSMITIINK